MARKWMYDRVSALPLAVSDFGGRVMETGAGQGPGGVDDMPSTPFIVIRASTNQPPLAMGAQTGVRQQRFQVWVHDLPGDTSKIDAMVHQLENSVPTDTGDKTPEGRFLNVKWEDTSGDGFDDHFQTTVRYVTFLVTWRPAVQS